MKCMGGTCIIWMVGSEFRIYFNSKVVDIDNKLTIKKTELKRIDWSSITFRLLFKLYHSYLPMDISSQKTDWRLNWIYFVGIMGIFVIEWLWNYFTGTFQASKPKGREKEEIPGPALSQFYANIFFWVLSLYVCWFSFDCMLMCRRPSERPIVKIYFWAKKT